MRLQVVEAVVEILGKTYHVKCPETDVHALHQAAKHLETRLRAAKEGSQSIGFDSIAIVAALNITHDLLAAERQKNQLSQMVNQKLIHLNNQIDEALINYSQMEWLPEEEV